MDNLPVAALGEQSVAALVSAAWTAELGETHPAEQGFLASGGHSLAAARIAIKLRGAVGVDLPMSFFLRDNPTLSQLIERAWQETQADRAARVGPVEATGAAGPPGTDASRRSAPIGPNLGRLWVWHRLHPESPAYNVARVMQVEGRLDPGALRAALADIATRHEALRCAVSDDGGQPQFVVHDVRPVQLAVEVCHAGADQLLRRLVDRPFDLAAAPLWRAGLIYAPRLGRSWVLVVLHHLIADLRASNVVLADLAIGYAARAEGRAPRYQNPPASLLRYLARSHEQEGSPEWEVQLDWWRHRFRDVRPPTARFALARREPGDASFSGDTATIELGRSESAAVDARMRADSLTPAVYFLAATACVIGAWSGASTEIIGVPSARADHADDLQLVAFCLDTLILPVDIDPGMSFRDVCGHVRETMLAVLEHSLPPFDRIVDALAVHRAGGRTPMLRVWFNDITQACCPSRLGQAAATEYQLAPAWALFDVCVYVEACPGGYRLHLVTASGLLASTDARALVRQISQLAVRAAQLPDQSAGALLAAVPTATSAAGTPGTSLPGTARPVIRTTDLVSRHALTAPGAPAIGDVHGTVSYGELAHLVERAAAPLRRLPAGTVVLIQARRDRAFVVSLLACWAAEVTAAIIDAAWPAERRRRAIAVCGASHELLDSGALRPIPAADAIPAQPMLAGRFSPANQPGAAERHDTAVPKVGHVLFTSGTTGDPLAVLVRAGSTDTALADLVSLFGLAAADRVSFLSGPAHDPALRDIGLALRAGGCLRIPPPDVAADPALAAAWLCRGGVTVVNATPPLLGLALGLAPCSLPDLRLVICAGAPLSRTVAELVRTAAPGATLVNGYGCTETPQVVAANVVAPSDPVPDGSHLSIGIPLAGRRVEVRDASNRLCEVGVLGTLWVSAPHIAIGYAGPADRGRLVTDDNELRWFRTGDLARRDAAGQIWLAGRVDRQALVNGYRFTMDEVEAVAREVDGVTEAICELVTGPAGDAVRIWIAGPAVRAESVRARFAAVLPPGIATARIIISDRLRLSESRKPVPAPSAGHPSAAAEPLPRAELVRLHAVTESYLGHPVGLTDNFFDVGFTSMSLLQFSVELGALLERHVAPLDLFRHPNLRALGQVLFGADQVEFGSPPAGSRAAELAGRLAALRTVRIEAQARLEHRAGKEKP